MKKNSTITLLKQSKETQNKDITIKASKRAVGKKESKTKPLEESKMNATVKPRILKNIKAKEISKQEMVDQRTKQLKIANRLEDKNIKKIEKQLKLHKRKSKTVPKSFVDDGLDYLLEVCDPESRSKLAQEEFDFADNDAGFEEDLALLNPTNAGDDFEGDPPKRNKEQKLSSSKTKHNLKDTHFENSSQSEDSESSDKMDDYPESNCSLSECNEFLEEETHSKKKTSNKIVEESDTGESDESESDDCESNTENSDEESGGFEEDIYGRLRDKKGNVVKEEKTSEQSGKYIPPGKRLANSSESCADIQKVKRQLKGLFNRLAETNLPNIVSSIEKLYLSNSRHNMQQAINALVIESLAGQILSPERLIMEHCVLIAALHANVGAEVGAQFLELVIRKFDSSYQSSDVQTTSEKELDNLILIIAHLYNFGLVAASLVKDILHMLAERFGEKDIELILIILRTVGFALRKDDPASLKQIIVTLQTKAGQASEQPARIRFMLEVLLAIRNNNMTKIPNYDPSHTEHLRKILRSLTKKGDALCKLNISYDELLAADKRGRWWVVGSAWSGQGPTAASSLVEEESTNTGDEPQYSTALLEMARKQRMNTEVRRNIFCILMTAEDFIEAFERLMRLGLKGQQEREIVHVIMDCCFQEKTFNPYYALLLQKLCHFHRRFQIASQFALWDHFKNLATQSQLQISHLSKLVVHLTLEGSLSLSVLRVIQFTEMDRLLVRFIRQILLGTPTDIANTTFRQSNCIFFLYVGILLHPSENSIKSAFMRIGSSKFGLLKEGLVLFMHHFLMKNTEKMNACDAEKLRDRIHMIEQSLGVN